MKFSIIIPVYNSKKYLKNCIDSILSQTYKNYEIILVDDESTDGSERICDEYSKKDKRIICIHKKNGGTAAARNTGIKKATGKYITFIDNDDYWSNDNALYEINEYLTESKADILMYDTNSYWENLNKLVEPNRTLNRDKVVNKPKEKALCEIIKSGCMCRAVWAKVIKRELIVKNNIYFRDGIRNEDTEFTGKLILYAETYDWYDKRFYIYRKGTGSAQTDKKVSLKEVTDLLFVVKEFKKAVESKKFKDDIKNNLYSYISYPYAVLIGQSYELRESLSKDQYNDIKEMDFLINYDLDPSVKKVKIVRKLFGYKITAMFLNMYLHRNKKIKRESKS